MYQRPRLLLSPVKSTAGPGGLPIPVGISQAWFKSATGDYCNQNIKFHPTGSMEGCAGWHTYAQIVNGQREISSGQLLDESI